MDSIIEEGTLYYVVSYHYHENWYHAWDKGRGLDYVNCHNNYIVEELVCATEVTNIRLIQPTCFCCDACMYACMHAGGSLELRGNNTIVGETFTFHDSTRSRGWSVTLLFYNIIIKV